LAQAVTEILGCDSAPTLWRVVPAVQHEILVWKRKHPMATPLNDWETEVTRRLIKIKSTAQSVCRRFFTRNRAEMVQDTVSQACLLILADQGGSRRPDTTFDQYIYVMVLKAAGEVADRKHDRLMSRLRRLPPMSAVSVPVTVDGTDGTDEPLQTPEQVRAALEGLSEQLKRPLVMRYYDGLATSQIATALGTTENAVNISMCRGRKVLRGRLRPRGETRPTDTRRCRRA
jgi:RNA polymerase sigma factor (sigma-70 family)